MDAEEWRDIPGYEGLYQASSLGRIKSLRSDHIMTPSRSPQGYFNVTLSVDGQSRCTRAHRAVALAFIPNPDGLAEVNHKDFNRTNNRPDNLEWASKKSNVDHALAAGHYDPAKNPKRLKKLALADVAAIREAQGKRTARDLAKAYGVSDSAIYNVWKGKSYASTSNVVFIRKPPKALSKNYKMNETKVRQMRAMAAAGAGVEECSKAFGINRETARAIIKRQIWVWVQDLPEASNA